VQISCCLLGAEQWPFVRCKIVAVSNVQNICGLLGAKELRVVKYRRVAVC
jgi:hypothetical protein